MEIGYADTLVRVNLTDKTITRETLSHEFMNKWLGGTGIGVKLMYDEVPPSVPWDSPDNKLIFSSGALSAIPARGTGAYGVVTKGPLTGGFATSQAMGYFGALMRFANVVSFVFEGKSDDWVYLYMDGEHIELKSAEHLVGLDSIETQDVLHEEYNVAETAMSVSCIGPAGENLVKFSMITGDYGHVAAHNGVGAVMGSKKLKAVAIKKNIKPTNFYNREKLKETAKKMGDAAYNTPIGPETNEMGTNAGFFPLHKMGILPVKNLKTSVFEEHLEFWGKTLRNKFEYKKLPCWGCDWTHCGTLKIKDGPMKGKVFEEPEYEALAAMGSIIFNKDNEAGLVLCDRLDRLGLDCNETGWLMGWVMECYEEGYMTKEQLDGIDMTWGNSEGVFQLLWNISYRIGFGDFLANGVKQCAEELGGEAKACAVYTLKGNTPRGHDHRADWKELLDICVSSTGTVEVVGGGVNLSQHGAEPVKDRFDPLEIARYNAVSSGRRVLEDSLGVCRMIAVEDINNTVEALHYATGDEWCIEKAMSAGRRFMLMMRIYNMRSGLTAELEMPSERYSSPILDGPNAGLEIIENFMKMRTRYYELMGWDENGIPTAETLKKYDLEDIVGDLDEIAG